MIENKRSRYRYFSIVENTMLGFIINLILTGLGVFMLPRLLLLSGIGGVKEIRDLENGYNCNPTEVEYMAIIIGGLALEILTIV